MNINWTKIASYVEGVAGIVAEFAPVAAAAGPEGALIGGIVGKGASLIHDVTAQAAAAGEAVASGDLAKINAADDAAYAADQLLAEAVDKT